MWKESHWQKHFKNIHLTRKRRATKILSDASFDEKLYGRSQIPSATDVVTQLRQQQIDKPLHASIFTEQSTQASPEKEGCTHLLHSFFRRVDPFSLGSLARAAIGRGRICSKRKGMKTATTCATLEN